MTGQVVAPKDFVLAVLCVVRPVSFTISRHMLPAACRHQRLYPAKYYCGVKPRASAVLLRSYQFTEPSSQRGATRAQSSSVGYVFSAGGGSDSRGSEHSVGSGELGCQQV